MKKVINQFIEHFDFTTLEKMILDLRNYKSEFPNGDKDIDIKIECVGKRMMQILEKEYNLTFKNQQK